MSKSNQLTLWQGDSLANHSALPGTKEAIKMTVTSGRRCMKLLKNCDPQTQGLMECVNGRTQPVKIAIWPTPRANKVHPEITDENRERLGNRNRGNLEEVVAMSCTDTGQLNPEFVEWLMGVPIGWSALNVLGTAKSACAHILSGNSSWNMKDWPENEKMQRVQKTTDK